MSRLFGPVVQNGYLVEDMDAALEHWTQTLGVGPFFLIDRVALVDPIYRGAPLDLDMRMALANSGDLQIELIVQRNRAPSIYTEWLDAGRTGLHHVGFFCDDIDRTLAALGPTHERVQYGSTGTGGAFAYLDTEHHPGTYVELIQRDAAMRGLFEMIRTASVGWNGDAPVRRLG